MPRSRAADLLGQAALNQFVTVGADSITMDGIAARAGLSIGAAYQWQPSLEGAVQHVLHDELPVLAGEIARNPVLERWLQPSSSRDRLLTESLLAIRRFPAIGPLVARAVDVVSQALDPLGLAVLTGSQAITVAGCSLPAPARTAVAHLYARIQKTDEVGDLPWRTPSAAILDGVHDLATVREPAGSGPDQIGERLIAATARVLASPGDTTLRTIAQSAGLSTGAIYRRYDSKDQLVADTIRAHLTSQRTTWAIPFVARLAGTQDGDPATVLAEQLALAGNADPEQTRLALEFLVASRVSPDARQVLVQRITDAQQARQSLFEVMQRSEIFSRPDTPLALSWALQITPTGTRLLSLVTPQPDQEQWQPVMARLIRAL